MVQFILRMLDNVICGLAYRGNVIGGLAYRGPVFGFLVF